MILPPAQCLSHNEFVGSQLGPTPGSAHPQATEKLPHWVDSIILLYSICDCSSSHWPQQPQYQQPVPVILVGNMWDLAAPAGSARQGGPAPAPAFTEVSAAETYHGALLVFHQLLEVVRGAGGRATGIHGIIQKVSAASSHCQMG